ncbi:hypothetical protein HOU72_gp45 [Pectobacterium phage Khlen]|uniref:Uncharacterized protein n=2 Tax=Phimunavirus khlen TaxID=2733340 RepID=A0A385IG93_9CAUD|nr:hypothetical protein HOU72_gp45 [Pectobacterium phage Khlen]AXY82043.1 hypothetical protein [Pectobacterium phage Slant]AZF94576.1 hypothetical protein [Pectobacterium phage Khlen]
MISMYLVIQLCSGAFCNNYAIESYKLEDAQQCVVDSKSVQGSWCEPNNK